MLPDKQPQPVLVGIRLGPLFKPRPGDPDDLVTQGDEVVERQDRGQIEPGPGRRCHGDAVDVGQLAGVGPHPMARHSGPANPGQFMRFAEVDTGTAAQPRRQAQQGQDGGGLVRDPGAGCRGGQHPGPFDDVQAPARGQVDKASAVGQVTRTEAFGRNTQLARLIDREWRLG